MHTKRLHLTDVQFTKYAYNLQLFLSFSFRFVLSFSISIRSSLSFLSFLLVFCSLCFIYDVGGLDTKSHLMGSMHFVFKLLAINFIQSDSFTECFTNIFFAFIRPINWHSRLQLHRCLNIFARNFFFVLSTISIVCSLHSFSFVH